MVASLPVSDASAYIDISNRTATMTRIIAALLLALLASATALRAQSRLSTFTRSNGASLNAFNRPVPTGDFYSKAKGLYVPKWDARGLAMADPDAPPEGKNNAYFIRLFHCSYCFHHYCSLIAFEVNPTRRDPDEPAPDIPVRLPRVDFGGTKVANSHSCFFLSVNKQLTKPFYDKYRWM